MASKVMEIISTGKLRKVDELCNSEQSKVVEMFTNIWGAGPTTAEGWYFKVSIGALIIALGIENIY